MEKAREFQKNMYFCFNVPGREDVTRNRFWLLGNSSRWGKKKLFLG